jgi:hypothetical protein
VADYQAISFYTFADEVYAEAQVTEKTPQKRKGKENQDSPRYALVIDHFVNPIMDQRDERNVSDI